MDKIEEELCYREENESLIYNFELEEYLILNI